MSLGVMVTRDGDICTSTTWIPGSCILLEEKTSDNDI